MLELARSMHADGRSVSASGALPTYIEGDSPWRPSTARTES
jgi:hypothetical protein